ncbi:MAG TPA: glycosyltransferase family 2 protein [Bradyrhizobium sp.]|nr:glycosyltransferase family 2 protein [Bradyrhizobium sp.]
MKISVITASYNSQKTIAFTIESFLCQRHPDKEMLVIDGSSSDETIKIVESFRSAQIGVFQGKDSGVYEAMNRGLGLFNGDVVGFLNSDDTFHDQDVLGDIAGAMTDADIVYGDLNMVTDHQTKHVVRSWRGGTFRRYSYQLGWGPPHPSFYMRREVAETVGEYDLTYITSADYDYMLRAIALNNFRIRYLPRLIADFQMGGISTRGWAVSVRGNLECLRSRRTHLRAPVIDAAFFLRLLRRGFQLRNLGS